MNTLFFTRAYASKFKIRFIKEMFVIVSHWKIIIICFLALYLSMSVGRNLSSSYQNAFDHSNDANVTIVRYDDLIQNFGYFDNEWKFLPELIIYSIHGIVVFLLVFIPLLPHLVEASSSVAYICLVRIFPVCMIGHFLRTFVYLATYIPSTALHCEPGSEVHSSDISLLSALRIRSFVDKSCGDMLYSGHQMQTLVVILGFQRYSKDIISSARVRFCILVVLWTLGAILPVFIVAAGNHYSVDVVVSSYITPLLWITFNKLVVDKSKSVIPSLRSKEESNLSQSSMAMKARPGRQEAFAEDEKHTI